MNDSHWAGPPSWSLLTGQAGRLFIILAATMFAVSFFAWVLGSKQPSWVKVGKASFVVACMSMFSTFLCLAALFVANRFEYTYVWEHADSRNAIAYRIAGIWSGQQGSFLLWGVAGAIFALLVMPGTGKYRRWFTATYSIFLGTICGILAFETPYALNLFLGRPVVPLEGLGLSPALQNYWVTIHPPTIFMGFGSLTALFALAVSAMLTRDSESWIPIVRPWAIVSTSLVGIGLCMGGFWAYETLGWGGFWMWDPVENVSFVPWVLSAALLHGVIVQATRKRWQITNLLYAGLPFLAFTYGTFLTRSGVLGDSSVHSFANMDSAALKLLMGLMIFMFVGFFSIWIPYSIRLRKEARDQEVPSGANREGFYKAGTILLSGLGVATLIGMSVPFFMALAHRKPAAVEEHAYHLVVPWLFVPLMILMGLAPFIPWKGQSWKDVANRAYTVICIVVGICGFTLLAIAASPLGRLADLSNEISFPGKLEVKGVTWIMILFAICLFAVIGNLWRMREISKGSKLGLAPFVTHIGVALLMAGLILSRGFERKEQTIVMDGHPGTTSNFTIRYLGQTSTKYDRDNKLKLAVYDKGNLEKPLFVATPGLYYVKDSDGGADKVMMWPYIKRFPFHDVYLSLQPPQPMESDPMTLSKGDEKVMGGYVIKYLDMTLDGQPGQMGTKFGAKLQIKTPDGKTTIVNPTMELSSGGPVDHTVPVDNNVSVAMTRMDAGSQSVTIQFETDSGVFPIEMFQKPFVGFVWLGAGVMTLGGLLSAYYRRRVPVVEAPARKVPNRQPVGDKVLVKSHGGH